MAAPMATSRPTMAVSRRPVQVQALFKSNPSSVATKDKTVSSKTQPKKEEKRMTPTVLEALDFAAPRSRKDADLLWEAKSNWKKGESKLSREEYAALARKIRGTAKDYWKDYVVEERIEDSRGLYYKPTESSGAVPFLPVLVGIVLAMLATTVLVVAQTSS